MKTHGSTRTHLLLLTILATSSVLSTGLQIYNLANNTSEENTSTNLESLEVKAGRFAVRVTGKKYYGSSDELNTDRKSLGNECFRREIISLHNTKGWVNYEETKQLFLNNVLSETENYYNSNILGRYMKKDYYNEQRIS